MGVKLEVPDLGHMTWMEWQGSPFKHPDCPKSAKFYVSYGHGHLDKTAKVEFFDTIDDATAGRCELNRQGYYTSHPWAKTARIFNIILSEDESELIKFHITSFAQHLEDNAEVDLWMSILHKLEEAFKK
jgi:hypothetical protein